MLELKIKIDIVMEKKLVIVESPSKVKSISKYLGKGYEVKASKGHVVDLPKKELGVDVEKKYQPKYVITKKAVVQDLKKAFQDKDVLVLAVDPDREGEAIGWHVAQRLGVVDKKGKVKPGKKLERIVFGEITESAVKNAAKNPRGIDMNLVDSQQTRRVLDRLVGYKLSPLLWKKIRYGLSAGRVQSVAVKLIVDKERERQAFKSEEYWNIDAFVVESPKKSFKVTILKDEDKSQLDLSKKKGTRFSLVKIDDKKPEIKNEKQANKISEAVVDKDWIISSVEKSASTRRPPVPFKTSTLQQAAAGALGYSSKRTMQLAQKLYEQGRITYMRTDSISLSNDAIQSARNYVKSKYGAKYIPDKPRYYKTKSKVAQEAHEAIRPTHFNFDEKKIKSNDEKKLYRLIKQRTLASQMSDAEVDITTVTINIDKYSFEAKGQRIKFDGFMKIYKDYSKEVIIGDFEKGQKVGLDELMLLQKFTQPPARYSEPTLIKMLEKEGIGRPSTYSSIISTILARHYVEKEGKYFVPTDMGFVVTRFLEENFPTVVDVKFTAELEDDLDEIASGKENWAEVVGEFYKPFETKLNKKEESIDRGDYTVLEDAPKDIKCPDCGGKMNVKLGKYGRFYSCKKWPDCKGMMSLGGTEEDYKEKAQSKEFLEKYKSAPKTDDGRDYLLKQGRYGEFWAHPDYPKVKDAKPLEYTDEVFKQLYGSAPKGSDGKKMILRRGKFGEFWAHPDYPKVKEVERINKKELTEKKKELGIEN